MYQISQDTELYEWDPILTPSFGNSIGFSQNFYELAMDEVNNPVLLWFSSKISGIPFIPAFCHCVHEYGCPGSPNEVTNLTPNSAQSCSNASTAGTP